MTLQPRDDRRAARQQRKIEKKRAYSIKYDAREVWVMLGVKRIKGGSIWGVRCTVHAGGNVHSKPSGAAILAFGPLGFAMRDTIDNRTVTLVFEGPAFTFTYNDRGDPRRAYAFAAEFNRVARNYDGLAR